MRGSENDLRVNERRDGDRVTLAIRGEIDLGSAPVLRASLDDVIAATHPVVVIDLSDVTFMDSTGLGMLAVAHQTLVDAGRRLIVRGAHGVVRRVINVSGLDRAVQIE